VHPRRGEERECRRARRFKSIAAVCRTLARSPPGVRRAKAIRAHEEKTERGAIRGEGGTAETRMTREFSRLRGRDNWR
jgi:hypothetical protein